MRELCFQVGREPCDVWHGIFMAGYLPPELVRGRKLGERAAAGVLVSQLTGTRRCKRPTSPFRRLGAIFLDLALVSLLLFGGRFLAGGENHSFTGILSGWHMGLPLVVIADVVLLLTSGQTIGKCVFGIRIVRDDGNWAQPWRLALRAAIYLPLAVAYRFVWDARVFWCGALCIMCLDAFFALKDGGRALHDAIAGTAVIRR